MKTGDELHPLPYYLFCIAIRQPAQCAQLLAPHEGTPAFLSFSRFLIQTAISRITKTSITRSVMFISPFLLYFLLIYLYFLSKSFAFLILLEEQHVDHCGQYCQCSDKSDNVNFTLDR